MDRKIVELLIESKSARAVMRLLKLGDRRVRKIRLLAEKYGYLGKLPPTFSDVNIRGSVVVAGDAREFTVSGLKVDAGLSPVRESAYPLMFEVNEPFRCGVR